jgi:hypothetical protein
MSKSLDSAMATSGVGVEKVGAAFGRLGLESAILT